MRINKLTESVIRDSVLIFSEFDNKLTITSR